MIKALSIRKLFQVIKRCIRQSSFNFQKCYERDQNMRPGGRGPNKSNSPTFKLLNCLDRIFLMSYKKYLNDKLKRNELKHQNHACFSLPLERVNIIAEARMFFLIFFSCYSFYIIPPLLKSDSYLPKTLAFVFIYSNESPFEMMKNVFYFMLNVLFVLPIS